MSGKYIILPVEAQVLDLEQRTPISVVSSSDGRFLVSGTVDLRAAEESVLADIGSYTVAVYMDQLGGPFDGQVGRVTSGDIPTDRIISYSIPVQRVSSHSTDYHSSSDIYRIAVVVTFVDKQGNSVEMTGFTEGPYIEMAPY